MPFYLFLIHKTKKKTSKLNRDFLKLIYMMKIDIRLCSELEQARFSIVIGRIFNLGKRLISLSLRI